MHCPRFVIALVLLLPLSARAAEPALHARIDSNVAHYVVNRDQTYTLTESMDATLLSRRALQALDRAVFTFYPDKQTLELVEAWVTQPDGSRVTVPPGSVFQFRVLVSQLPLATAHFTGCGVGTPASRISVYPQ